MTKVGGSGRPEGPRREDHDSGGWLDRVLKSFAGKVTLAATLFAALTVLLRNARELADTWNRVSSLSPAVADDAPTPLEPRNAPPEPPPSRPATIEAPSPTLTVGTAVSTPDYGTLFVGGSCVSDLLSKRGGYRTLHEIWNCVLPRGGSMARIRCSGGSVVAEYCDRGCTTNPNGTDDYCR